MRKKNSVVLGLFVTDTSIEGVLLREDQDGNVHLVERTAKNRSRKGETVLKAGSILPGLKDKSESDYTMEVGDGSQLASELFMSTEFGESGGGVAVAEKVRTDTSTKKLTTPFGSQLREILAECREAGFPNPPLAFCMGSSEVSYHEMGLQTSGSEKNSDEELNRTKLTREDKKTLRAKLDESIQGDIDKKRTAFLRMVPISNRRRYLAVVPSTPDPVSTALDILARSSKHSPPSAHIVDSEISLLISLVNRRRKETEGVTAIVRVSAADTTVLFLKDGVLDKYEHLRSLTSYDSIDTVCSRVVLKQDELRIGTIDELLVSTEHQGSSAIGAFASFFPNSDVYDLKDALEDFKLVGPKVAELKANSVPATAVALRLLQDWDRESKDVGLINLLDKKRRGTSTRKKGAYAWHTMFLLAAIFGTALYFTWTFMSNQELIDVRNEEIKLNPPQFPTEDAALISFRVDSLQRVYQNHNRAMFVLDSLLTGSDKWSSTLDNFTHSTRSIGRIWFKAWTPQQGSIRLEGNALARNRIASLAQQWNGSIEKLNFAEIQGLRIYSFIMSIPIQSKLPSVVAHLRQTSLEELEPEEAEALTSLSNSALHTHSN